MFVIKMAKYIAEEVSCYKRYLWLLFCFLSSIAMYQHFLMLRRQPVENLLSSKTLKKHTQIVRAPRKAVKRQKLKFSSAQS